MMNIINSFTNFLFSNIIKVDDIEVFKHNKLKEEEEIIKAKHNLIITNKKIVKKDEHQTDYLSLRTEINNIISNETTFTSSECKSNRSTKAESNVDELDKTISMSTQSNEHTNQNENSSLINIFHNRESFPEKEANPQTPKFKPKLSTVRKIESLNKVFSTANNTQKNTNFSLIKYKQRKDATKSNMKDNKNLNLENPYDITDFSFYKEISRELSSSNDDQLVQKLKYKKANGKSNEY